MSLILLLLTIGMFGYTSFLISGLCKWKTFRQTVLVGYFFFLVLVASNIFVWGIIGYLRPNFIFLTAFIFVLLCCGYEKRKSGTYFKLSAVKNILNETKKIFAKENGRLFILLLTFIVIAHLGFGLFLVYLFPDYAFDDLWYHSTTIAFWIHEGAISIPPYSIWSQTYPFNAELVYTLVPLFLKNDTWIEIGQLPFVFLGMLAIYCIAKDNGISTKYSYVSGLLFYLIPTVFSQSITNYTDIAMVSTFLALLYFANSYRKNPIFSHIVLVSICSGFLIGIKFSSIAYIGVSVFIIITLPLFYRMKKRGFLFKELLFHHIVLLIGTLIGGAFWYVRTWVQFGNPIYPFLIKIQGKTIFNGYKTMNELIMNTQTPSVLLPFNNIERILYSWTHLSYDTYMYDGLIGGLGILWLCVLLPCFLLSIFSIYRKKKELFWFIFVPIVLCFFIQPSNWWARYTVSVVVLGIVSFVYILQSKKVKFIHFFMKTLVILIVIIEMYFYAVHGVLNTKEIHRFLNIPKEERTIGKLIRPMYNWVYKLDKPSRIGYVSGNRPRVDKKYMDDETIFPYFGKKFQHKPINLKQKSKSEFFRTIKDENLNYLSVPKESIYDRWIQESNYSKKVIDRKYEIADKNIHIVYELKKPSS